MDKNVEEGREGRKRRGSGGMERGEVRREGEGRRGERRGEERRLGSGLEYLLCQW